MGAKTKSPPSVTRLEQFAKFLIDEGALGSEGLDQAFKVYGQLDKRIGQLAVLKGYIKPQDIFSTVSKQMESDLRFGQEALRKARLSERELNDLLAMQANSFRMFLEVLVISRVISKKDLKQAVTKFLRVSKNPCPEESLPSSEPIVPLEVLKKRSSRISAQEMKSRLREIKNLSALPKVVQKVLALLGNRESDLKEIAILVEKDVGLATSMLQMVNSAATGMRTQVDSIDQAVVILGFEGVRRLVLAASVVSKFKMAGSLEGKAIWTHSALTGEWARVLTRELRGPGDEAEDAFTGGLLHDMGKFALWEYFPDVAEKIQTNVLNGIPALEAEHMEMGMSHPEIGGFLCHFWKFPEVLEEAVAYHHSSTRVLKNLKGALPLTNVVNAACRLANLGYTYEPEDESIGVDLKTLDNEFLSFHNLNPDFISKNAEEVYKRSEEMVAGLM